MRTAFILLFLSVSSSLLAFCKGDDGLKAVTTTTKNNAKILIVDENKLEYKTLKIIAPNGVLIYTNSTLKVRGEKIREIEIKETGIYWLLIDDNNHKIFQRLIITKEPNEN